MYVPSLAIADKGAIYLIAGSIKRCCNLSYQDFVTKIEALKSTPKGMREHETV